MIESHHIALVSEAGQAPASLAGQPAGFVSRFIALLIDIVLLVLTIMFINAPDAALAGAPPVQWMRGQLIAVAPWLAPWMTWTILLLPVVVAVIIVCGYFLFFFTITGQTIGKRVLGLRVVPNSGGRLLLRHAALRIVGYLISTAPLYLGFLAMLMDTRRRTWHDRLAGTTVIYAWDARPDERFLKPQPPNDGF